MQDLMLRFEFHAFRHEFDRLDVKRNLIWVLHSEQAFDGLSLDEYCTLLSSQLTPGIRVV